MAFMKRQQKEGVVMQKRKCPACGSTNTIEIMYGMPTHEAFESAERGEIALGGCCITDCDPQRHCKNCGENFDYRNMISTFSIEYLEFSVGGFFGTSHYIYVDGKQKNKIIRYAKVPGGMHVDLKHPNKDINNHFRECIVEIPISNIDWLKFTEDIEALEISCWQDKYVEPSICDGTQWELKLKVAGKRKINKYGSNKYPPYWKKFIKILSNYIGENIE
jgi:hypothetical protein